MIVSGRSGFSSQTGQEFKNHLLPRLTRIRSCHACRFFRMLHARTRPIRLALAFGHRGRRTPHPAPLPRGQRGGRSSNKPMLNLQMPVAAACPWGLPSRRKGSTSPCCAGMARRFSSFSIRSTAPSRWPKIALHPKRNRTGDHWHILVAGLPTAFCYGWRVDGPAEPGHHYDPNIVLIDPVATMLSDGAVWGRSSEPDAARHRRAAAFSCAARSTGSEDVPPAGAARRHHHL